MCIGTLCKITSRSIYSESSRHVGREIKTLCRFLDSARRGAKNGIARGGALPRRDIDWYLLWSKNELTP